MLQTWFLSDVSIGRNSDYDHCIHSSCKWTPGNDAYESNKDHTHP